MTTVRGPARRLAKRGRLGLAAAVCLLALTGAPMAVALMQVPDESTPESGTAQVAAQGVVDISDQDLRWQVVERIAPPPANASPVVSEPGFLAVSSGVVLVEDRQTGVQHRLPAGEAMLTNDGAEQWRVALGAEAATYLDLTLVAADQGAPAEGEVLLASEPFVGPGGRHDLDLLQDALGPGLQMSIPAGSLASLVVIESGAADVTTESGDVVSLAAGEAAAFAGALVLTAGENGALVSAVRTGPAVPRLTQPSGTPTARRVVETEGAIDAPPVATPAATVEPEQSAESGGSDDDGDGLTRRQERDAGTDPALADTDEDGLTDGQEVLEFGTDPLSADSDADGVLDGDEVAQGADPLDGLAGVSQPAAVEEAPVEEAAPAAEVAPVAEEPVAEEPVAEAPVAEAPVAGDGDADGLEDAIEAELGTDPFDTDTDDDGLSDGDEYYTYQTGTRNPDTDADGVLDGTEAVNGTNPNDPNSA